MNGDVIDLEERRVVPGTLWWSGTARCIHCDHEHLAVAPMPAWALAPGNLECPACGSFGALAMVASAGGPCPT